MPKKTRRRIKNNLKCGPYTMKHGQVAKDTCLTPDLMLKVRDAYNKAHPEVNRKIESKDPQQIWRILKTRVQFCNNEGEEECWMSTIKDSALKRDIQKYIYAPHAPKEWKKNPNEWLTNFDILNVMHQYEYTYPTFKFFGPSPIDFDARPDKSQCVTRDICNFNLEEQIKSGKKQFGFVFNLDEHDEPGSHWVSMFVDVPHKFIYFFDSASLNIPKEVDVLVDRIVKQGAELGIEFQRMKNKVEHQFGNTECGVYSLFFIITMLTGNTRKKVGGKLKTVSMEDRLRLFTTRKIPDHMMARYRKIYYSGGNNKNV